MQEARRRAVAKRIDRFEASKGNTDSALEQLSFVLGRRLEWPIEAAAFAPRIDAAVQWGSARVASEEGATLSAHRPRAAQQSLARRSRYLQSSAFSQLKADLGVRIHTEAVTRCNALDQELATPFLRHFASAYCGAFNAPWTPATTPLPFMIGRFDVATEVDGLTPPQSEQVVAKLNASLRETRWYSPSAPEGGRAHVTGLVAANFSVEDVVLKADYTVRVPYTAWESYEEPYQETYTDTESYTESVPYTVWGSESYSCGSYDHPQTCSRSTSHTEYRTEYRTRPVTRTRTKYRSETRMVTRYRDEDRTHEYNARKHHGRYNSVWRVFLQSQDWPTPLSLQFQRNASETGIEHDETFEPADVFPTHEKLRSHAQWADKQFDDLENEVIETMTNAWTKAFCAQSTYEPEEAARCVYGDRDGAPALAKEVLRRTFFGDEINFVTPISK